MHFLTPPLPDFEEFEAWVLAKNGGAIAPERVARLNGALTGTGSFTLESILPEPVLSAADLAFWEEQGYVVVKQAVSHEQCQAAAQAILEHAGMDLRRPDSWYAGELWILLAHHPALWANCQAGRIHTAFAQIWQRADLWMNVDVCGVIPLPTAEDTAAIEAITRFLTSIGRPVEKAAHSMPRRSSPA